MRLYSGKIGPIVDDLVRDLTAGEDIEVEDVAEVRLDLEAVLKEYVRRERQMIDEAKDRMEREGLGYSKLGRMRQRLAKEMGFPQQDEVLPYLVDQLLNMLFHSSNVLEIYADDATLAEEDDAQFCAGTWRSKRASTPKCARRSKTSKRAPPRSRWSTPK